MTMASPSMMVGGSTLSNHHNHNNSNFMTPSTTTTTANNRSHILLGASRNSGSLSMRIEDPKKSSSIASPAMAAALQGASPSPSPTLQSGATAATFSSSLLNITGGSSSNSPDIADDASLRIMLEKVPQVRTHFSVVEKLGEGTFSKVYKAVRLQPSSTDDSSDNHQQTSPSSSSKDRLPVSSSSYALKYLTPIVKPNRVAKELRFLRDLQGQSNIVQLLGCFFAAGHTVLVMPIIEHVRFQDVYQRMDVDEAREYLRNLLIALDRVHRLGIIHRDIKPANFLYNRDRRQYVLVDFGLSQTQKEIDSTAQYTMHQAMGLGGAAAIMAAGSRSAPPVRPCDASSRVRSNLSIRFKNDALIMQRESNKTPINHKAAAVCRRNLTASLTTLSPTKTCQQQPQQTNAQTPLKTKRPFAEIENQSNVKDENKIDQQQQNQSAKITESPVKRQRICGMDFIERVVEAVQSNTSKTTTTGEGVVENSTISTTPTTNTTSIISSNFYIPETPVKGLRTPLGNRDSNQGTGGGGGLCTASIAPLSLNFTTPTKQPLAMEVDHHQRTQILVKTPVKNKGDHHEKMKFVPETPPKAVQKNLIFAASAKSALKQKENQSTVTTTTTTTSNHHNNNTPMLITANSSYQQHHNKNSQKQQHISNAYSTPKTISYTSMKRLQQQSKRLLGPELISSAVTVHKPTDLHHQNTSSTTKPCDCTDQAFICYGCLSKPELNVPRAGTPGFRAPEILLRSTRQTAKLDIWSAGVIFASILSGRYPFFRCIDDFTCLAEIITIFGSSRVKRAASALGKYLLISDGRKPPVDLKTLCSRLRSSLEAAQPTEVLVGFEAPDSAYDLLAHLLDPNPSSRYSAAEALNHPFFREKGHSLIDLIAE